MAPTLFILLTLSRNPPVWLMDEATRLYLRLGGPTLLENAVSLLNHSVGSPMGSPMDSPADDQTTKTQVQPQAQDQVQVQAQAI